MTDGTTLAVPLVHLPLIHGENVFADHYIHVSDLAALISNPIVLAKVERNPSLRAAVLSNPFLVEEISHDSKLLNLLIQNPSLISSILANPKLLTLIKQNPLIISEIVRNFGSSVEEILQNISEGNKPNRPEENIKNITEKKPIQPQVLHKLEKPIVVTNKVSSTIKETIAKAGLKIPISIPTAKTIEGKVQTKIPLSWKQNARIYIDPKTLAMYPSLVALLGAIAFSASRTKIIPASGNSEELETQTERQLTTLQETSPIHEVEEASEVHLMKETIA